MFSPSIHVFDSSSAAYDLSQCMDNIHDGDILLVPSEHALAIMCEAWPVALTETSQGKAFHLFKLIGDETYANGWKSEQYVKYQASVELASKIELQWVTKEID